MAKQALTWLDNLPSCEKRETKVIRLLRSGGSHWGVTESQAEFVYPRSLQPLRKIAGVQEDSGKDERDADSTQHGLEVSALLDEAFPMVEEHQEGEEQWGGGVCAGSAAAANAADLAVGKKSGTIGKPKEIIIVPGASTEEEGKARRGRRRKTKKLAKPTFYPYGNGNTAPSAGGVVYGGYMLSHSISPQVRTLFVHYSCWYEYS